MKTVFAFVLCSALFANVSLADQRGRPVTLGVPGSPVLNPVVTPVQGQFLAAGLTSFSVDRRESFATANQGTISIDIARRTITLTVFTQPTCPANLVCAQFVGNFVTFELPFVKRTVEPRCGSVTYTASRDLRRVDGGLQQIDVIDNTHFSCPSRVRMVPTFVTFRQVPARASFNEQRTSTFFAAPLSNTLQAIPFQGQPVFAQ